LYGYKNFGLNRNAREIASLLPEEEKYWINSPQNNEVISVFNEETYVNPEWRWKLFESVPIRETLKVYEEQQSFTFFVGDMPTFRENLKRFKVKDVVLIITEVDQGSYPYQEFLDEFVSETWLQLEEKVEYKGMDVYIFKVIE